MYSSFRSSNWVVRNKKPQKVFMGELLVLCLHSSILINWETNRWENYKSLLKTKLLLNEYLPIWVDELTNLLRSSCFFHVFEVLLNSLFLLSELMAYHWLAWQTCSLSFLAYPRTQMILFIYFLPSINSNDFIYLFFA